MSDYLGLTGWVGKGDTEVRQNRVSTCSYTAGQPTGLSRFCSTPSNTPHFNPATCWNN